MPQVIEEEIAETTENKKAYIKELELIRKQHNGLLRPVDVVEFARNENTALHSKFTWDDTKAAHEYRLWQARQLIAITITIETPTVPEHRTYVSIKEHRRTPDGGYRKTVEVLTEEQSRKLLLKQALDELKDMKRRYSSLIELSEIFTLVDRIQI